MDNTHMLNEIFLSRADENSGEREKLAAVGGDFVRDKLREMSFWRKILPPKPVTIAECQRSLEHDTVYKIVDIEPNTRGMSISFTSQPDARLIKGRRMAISFHTVASLKWEGFTEHLRTYTYPIADVIKNNIVKDIQEIEDRTFLVHVATAIAAREQLANGGTVTNNKISNTTCVRDAVIKSEMALAGSDADIANSSIIHPLMPQDITALSKVFSKAGRSLRMAQVLMTEYTYQDFTNLTTADLGEGRRSDVMVRGFNENQVHGHKIIRTLKGNILSDGLVYGFTDPEFFGKAYILDNVKFYVKTEDRRISFWAWENIGMGLANIAGFARLELMAGDTLRGNEAGNNITALVAPAAEEDLGAANNRVVDGYTYPTLKVY